MGVFHSYGITTSVPNTALCGRYVRRWDAHVELCKGDFVGDTAVYRFYVLNQAAHVMLRAKDAAFGAVSNTAAVPNARTA